MLIKRHRTVLEYLVRGIRMTIEKFLEEKEKMAQLTVDEQKVFYEQVLEIEQEQSAVRLMAYFQYALLFYHEGNFRKAREVMEPFIMNYQNYEYRLEMISCINLMGVIYHCKGEYTLARYFYNIGIKMAEEHHEKSRLSYEYNNIALTYIAEQNFEEALEYVLMAQQYLSESDEEMKAYVYLNKAITYHNMGQLENALQAYRISSEQYHGGEILPDDTLICGAALFYKIGDQEKYEACKNKIVEKIDTMYASELMDACKALFDCGIDSGNDALVEKIIAVLENYLREHPSETKVGVKIEEYKYLYAAAKQNYSGMLEALEKKNEFYQLIAVESERQQVESYDQYFRVHRQMRVAVEKETKANRAKMEFLANMSHDIRTPINGIMGMLQVIKNCRDNERKVNECLKKIDVSSRHLLSLVNDVLDMTKLETDSAVLEHKPFNLDQVCSELDQVMTFQAEQEGLKVVYDHHDVKEVNLIGSAVHLKKILSNLFGNCIKYNKPGGAIYMRLRELSRTETTIVYEFRIRDTGVGMTQEFIDNQLFLPFTQGENAVRSRYGGTGLGMSIVRQLVQKMNGTIDVQSKLGEGSCFTVILPFEIDKNPRKQTKAEIPSEELQGKRILLVEDNDLNMEIAEFMLKDMGITVDTAENGKMAVEKYLSSETGTYDGILMDLMMPVMDGYEATERIRTSDHSDAAVIPIIAMSANAYAEDVQKCLNAGMNAHLSKPVFKEVLLTALAKYLR